MKTGKKIIFFILALAVIFSLATPATVSAADSKTLRILFTHDVHSSELPAERADSSGNLSEVGGFARLYTEIQAERKDPDSTLLVDAGDYSMGTLFQALETTEAPELRLMGAMGYDAITTGNHEFDYTGAGYAKTLEAAVASGDKLPAYVSSNMTVDESSPEAAEFDKALKDYGVKDYTVIDKNGVKIGIYGVLGVDAAADASDSAPASFGSIIDASKRVVKILKEQEKVDIIVCLSHSGTDPDVSKSEDEQLAKAVPDIDVIISGHTHTVLQQPITVGKTIIVSCGANSAYLGVLDLTYDNGWKAADYRLDPINSSVKDDPGMSAKVDAFKSQINDYLKHYGYNFDQVIANSPYQFEDDNYMFDHPNDYALGNLLSDALLYAANNAGDSDNTPITAAVVPMGIIRATLNKGNITVADSFKVLSLGTGPDGYAGYPLISVYLTGGELKNVCEVDASVASLLGDAQLFISGLKYTYNPNGIIFDKVMSCEISNPDGTTSKIEPNKLYRVVCGIYSGEMLAYVKIKSFGIISIIPKDKDGNPITDFKNQIIKTDKGEEIKEWQSVAEYLQSFPQQNGVSIIPAQYSAPQGRKTADSNATVWDIITHLNGFAFILLGVVVVILALIAFIIVLIATRKKRRAKRLARREARITAKG